MRLSNHVNSKLRKLRLHVAKFPTDSEGIHKLKREYCDARNLERMNLINSNQESHAKLCELRRKKSHQANIRNPEILEKAFYRRIKRVYKLSREEYLSILTKQNGVCAICGNEKADGLNRRLHCDHDHKTGKVRGLLCNSCNHLLGLVKDNSKLLDKASKYLTGC